MKFKIALSVSLGLTLFGFCRSNACECRNSDERFRVTKRWDNYSEAERRTNQVVSEELGRLIRLGQARDTPENRKKLADAYRKSYSLNPNEYWFSVRLETRETKEGLMEIAKELYPLDAKRRDRVEIRFHKLDQVANEWQYAIARFDGVELVISEMKLDEIQWKSFLGSEFPSSGRLVGRWIASNSVFQIERDGKSYRWVEFRSNGATKTIDIKKSKGNRYTRGLDEFRIERGDLIEYKLGKRFAKYEKLEKNPISADSVQVSGKFRSHLRDLLDRLIKAKAQKDLTIDTAAKGGKYFRLFEEIRNCQKQPPAGITFRLRHASKLLNELARRYVRFPRQRPIVGHGAFGEPIRGQLEELPSYDNIVANLKEIIDENDENMRANAHTKGLKLEAKPSRANLAPTSEIRTWTDSTGRFNVKAELIEIRGESIRLRKVNGKVIEVDIRRLSEVDRKFLREDNFDSSPTKDSNSPKSLTGKKALSPKYASKATLDHQTVLDLLQKQAAGVADTPDLIQIATQKAIDLGIRDEDEAESLIYWINKARQRSSKLIWSVRNREAISLSAGNLSDIYAWRSVILSFVDDARLCYNLLHSERRCMSKEVYRELAGARLLASYGVGQAKRRVQLRTQLAELLWHSSNRDDVPERSKELLDQISSSYRMDANDSKIISPDSLRGFLDASLSNVLENLPDAQTTIEIVRYDKYGPGLNGAHSKVANYVAFVVETADTVEEKALNQFSNTVSPRFVKIRKQQLTKIELGPCEPIDRLIRAWRMRLERMSGAENNSTETIANGFRRLVWEPIENAVGENTRLYFIVDANLQLVPWGAIPLQDGKYLIEKYEIALLPFLEYLVQTSRTDQADTTDLRSHSDKVTCVNFGLGHESKIDVFLTNLFGKTRTNCLTDERATIKNLIASLDSSAVVHFSTHGRYRKRVHDLLRPQELARSLSPKDYLLCSGLFLAPPVEGINSVLTADLVAELDMSHVRLAVLAACETSLGEPSSGEGRFGMRRSFQMAGCRDVLATLWRIHDLGSSLLIQDFYTNLEAGMAPMSALSKTQRDAIHGKFDELIKVKLPKEFWAGYIFYGPADRPISF